MTTYVLEILVEGKDHASSVLGGIGGALGGLGTAAVGLATAGLAAVGAGIGASISKAKDFDQTLSGLQAVSLATTEEMRHLSSAAIQIGKDTSFGASDAASAMEMLSANGLKVSEILGGAADATVALAAATGLKGKEGLSTAADIASSAMQVFGKSASELPGVINGISGVTVASKFDINDYALALAQAGGVADGVGVEMEDFNTTIAGISPLFASGSDAGTSFKTMLQTLIPKSKDAAAMMGQLGLMSYNTDKILSALAQSGLASTGDAFTDLSNYANKLANGDMEKARELMVKWTKEAAFMKNDFYDANGQLKGMDEIAGLLQRSLSGLSEEQRNNALNTIFGTDASRAALGMAKLGKQGFDDLAISIGKVDAADQARVRLNNLAGDLEALSGSLETAGIQLGQSFTPLLRDLTQAAVVFVNTHLIDRDWSPLVNGVTMAVSSVQSFITTLGGGITTLQSAFAAGGIFGILQQLGAWLQPGITSAQASFAQYAHMAVQWALDAAASLPERLNEWRNAATAYVTSNLPQWIATLQGWATAAGSWALDAIPTLLGSLLHWRNAVIGYVLEHLPEWIDTLGVWGAQLGAWIVKAAPAALDSFTGYTVELINLIGENLPTIIRSLAKWSISLLTWITDGTPGALGGLGGYVGRILDAVGAALPDIVVALGQWAGALISWVIDAAPKLLSNLLDLVADLGNWIGERVPIIAGYLATWIEGFAAWAGEVWPKLRVNLIGMWNTVSDWVLEYAPILVTTLAKWAWAFIEFIGPYIPRVLLALGDLVADVFQWIGAKTPELTAKLVEWATAFAGWVQTTAWPYLQEKLPILWNGFKQWISDKVTAIQQDGSIGRALGDAFYSGLSAAWGRLTQLATDIGMSIKDKFAEWGGAIRDAGGALIGNFWDGINARWQTLMSDMSTALQNLRNLLPGSEPKDPSSPLRGLGASGAALMRNFQGGMDSASLSVDHHLEGLKGALNTNLGALPSGATAGGGAITIVIAPVLNVSGSVISERDLGDAMIDRIRTASRQNGGLANMGVTL